MQDEIGVFVKPDSRDERGKPDAGENSGGTGDGEIRPPEPQVISGYEAYEPATERIAGAGSGGSDRDAGGGPRLTKSGRVDRRTLRGRTDAGAGAEKVSPDLTKISIDKILLGIHDTLAALTKIEEFELSKDEAKSYGDAITNVAKHYNTAFDPKKVAIFELVCIMGGIYSTRYMAYSARTKGERGPQLVQPAPAPKRQPEKTGTGPAITTPSQIWNEAGDSF